eukprot:scaffold284188_cov26-Tisochrysis_lutea.AAC.2
MRQVLMLVIVVTRAPEAIEKRRIVSEHVRLAEVRVREASRGIGRLVRDIPIDREPRVGRPACSGHHKQHVRLRDRCRRAAHNLCVARSELGGLLVIRLARLIAHLLR